MLKTAFMIKKNLTKVNTKTKQLAVYNLTLLVTRLRKQSKFWVQKLKTHNPFQLLQTHMLSHDLSFKNAEKRRDDWLNQTDIASNQILLPYFFSFLPRNTNVSTQPHS